MLEPYARRLARTVLRGPGEQKCSPGYPTAEWSRLGVWDGVRFYGWHSPRAARMLGRGFGYGFGPRAAVQVDAPWPSDRTDVGKAHCRSLKKNRPVSGETGAGCRSVGAAAIRTDVEVLAVLLGLCQAFRPEKESTNSYEYPFMVVTIPPVQPHHCSRGGRLASAVSTAAVRQKGASFCLSTELL
jgi:hypothetical protein